MKELQASQVPIQDPFWTQQLDINASRAIFHQWDELIKSGCIDNFRIVCNEIEGFREGWVFADSDAYKWLDAAARIHANHPDPKLKTLMDELVALLARTQTPDGYLYTYNQFHFAGQRWVNMQIEHELYCLGHLIEGCISHFQATGENTALAIAEKAADLLVKDFLGGPPEHTEGHQEVEIALLRLFQIIGHSAYLELARHFIEVRGRIVGFRSLYKQEVTSYEERKAYVRKQRIRHAATHTEYALSKIPPDNEAKVPPHSNQRRKQNALSGKYNQQHAPVRQQFTPEGHAVRYGYFQTATALLQRLTGDQSLLPALKKSWERMVTKRMYVTGGLGSLPGNEGFGHDYELDPEYAYTETCAALASLFWNWEMALITGEAKYSDLFEWQLYNAAAVGMGTDGDTYLYNNPLKVQGDIRRRAWYSVPCCPSNLSRTWAHIGKYIYSYEQDAVWIHQFIGNAIQANVDIPLKISMQSSLPFDGMVTIQVNPNTPNPVCLYLRRPCWSGNFRVKLNGEHLPVNQPEILTIFESTAQGYDPRQSQFLEIKRVWQADDKLEIEFELPIQVRRAHPKVKGHSGKVAITRGPLVYCLESIDNPGLDLFNIQLNPSSLHAETDPDMLGAITMLKAEGSNGEQLVLIPYYRWGNRGPSQMNVWIDTIQ